MTTTMNRSLKVSDVMSKEPVCVEPGTTIRQLAQILEENEISGAPVVAADGRLIGVVSKSDLIRRCSEGSPDAPPGYMFELLSGDAGEDQELIPEPIIVVQDFMSEDAITARPGETLGPVAHRMAENKVHRVIVIDEQNIPVGIVTSLDLLRVYPK